MRAAPRPRRNMRSNGPTGRRQRDRPWSHLGSRRRQSTAALPSFITDVSSVPLTRPRAGERTEIRKRRGVGESEPVSDRLPNQRSGRSGVRRGWQVCERQVGDGTQVRGERVSSGWQVRGRYVRGKWSSAGWRAAWWQVRGRYVLGKWSSLHLHSMAKHLGAGPTPCLSQTAFGSERYPTRSAFIMIMRGGWGWGEGGGKR